MDIKLCDFGTSLDFVHGVIMLHCNDGAKKQVVTIEAQSARASIKPSTLEQKVKETLNQIEAKILGDGRD